MMSESASRLIAATVDVVGCFYAFGQGSARVGIDYFIIAL